MVLPHATRRRRRVGSILLTLEVKGDFSSLSIYD